MSEAAGSHEKFTCLASGVSHPFAPHSSLAPGPGLAAELRTCSLHCLQTPAASSVLVNDANECGSALLQPKRKSHHFSILLLRGLWCFELLGLASTKGTISWHCTTHEALHHMGAPKGKSCFGSLHSALSRVRGTHWCWEAAHSRSTPSLSGPSWFSPEHSLCSYPAALLPALCVGVCWLLVGIAKAFSSLLVLQNSSKVVC